MLISSVSVAMLRVSISNSILQLLLAIVRNALIQEDVGVMQAPGDGCLIRYSPLSTSWVISSWAWISSIVINSGNISITVDKSIGVLPQAVAALGPSDIDGLVLQTRQV